MARLSVEQLISKGRGHLKGGKLSEAKNLFLFVLKEFPGNVRARRGLEDVLLALQTKGQLEPTQEHFDRLVRLFSAGNFTQLLPQLESLSKFFDCSWRLFNILAITSAALGEWLQAIDCYRHSLRLKPDNAEVLFNLAIAQKGSGDLEGAIETYKSAIQCHPVYPEAYCNLGQIFQELGNREGALDCFETALALKPSSHVAHSSLASLLLEFGMNWHEKAINHLRIAIELRPDIGEFYRIYAMSKKMAKDDPIVKKITEYVDLNNIEQQHLLHFNFALGKVEEDLGNYKESFLFYKNANRISKNEISYDISVDKNFIQNIKTFFDRKIENIDIQKSNIIKSNPIFVIGMPRSGTTLCEQIISSHSDVFGAGELSLFYQILRVNNWNMSNNRSDLFLSLRNKYIDVTKNFSNLSYFTDKLPTNFIILGYILQAFPEVKVVHTFRNPVAVCWSNYKRFFKSPDMSFTFDLKDVAQFYLMYTDLMAFWHQKFPGRIYDLSYEKLTENQEEETRKLFAYLGLDWEDKVLDFHKSERSVRTASNQQVRKKMYKGSSEEWKKYEPWLGEMLEILKPVM